MRPCSSRKYLLSSIDSGCGAAPPRTSAEGAPSAARPSAFARHDMARRKNALNGPAHKIVVPLPLGFVRALSVGERAISGQE